MNMGGPRHRILIFSCMQEVSSFNPVPSTIEDFNIGLVHFEDGSTMSLESNWLMHPRARSAGVEMLGDWGVASLRPLRVELDEGEQVIDATPELPEHPPNAYAEVCRDFCQAVRDQALPVVRFDEMLDVQAIMNALYESAEKGLHLLDSLRVFDIYLYRLVSFTSQLRPHVMHRNTCLGPVLGNLVPADN